MGLEHIFKTEHVFKDFYCTQTVNKELVVTLVCAFFFFFLIIDTKLEFWIGQPQGLFPLQTHSSAPIASGILPFLIVTVSKS